MKVEWSTNRAALRAVAERRFAQSMDIPTRFFEDQADAISNACLQMARRFRRGGRLLVFGEGAEATDAQHVSVEFVHPVIVGKRALPAIALTNDLAAFTGLRRMTSSGESGSSRAVVSEPVTSEDGFAQLIAALGIQHDIAMGITRDGDSGTVVRGLSHAHQLGMLTLGLAGGSGGRLSGSGVADFLFLVPTADPLVIQEVHETLYHVLWELVHIFFEFFEHQVVE